MDKLILGIESSCDETAAAVSVNGRKILSNIVYSQIDEHKKYGGVVPEIASRRHCENILTTVREALNSAGAGLSVLDGIAVTYAPGLIGALLVGTSFAKGLSMAASLPLIPVHHIAGHIASNYIAHEDLEPPFLCLVASGGHTMIAKVTDYTHFEILGTTRDDAAGEAFDKCARVLGYPYPGGVHIDRAASRGDSTLYKLPTPHLSGNELDFSFSGLKTAVINLVHNAEQKGETIDGDSLAAAFQKTASDYLTEKAMTAAELTGAKKLALAGGVSANSGVRSALEKACAERNISLYMPPLSLCGDNGAMIACQGYYELMAGNTAGEDLNAIATLPLGS